MKLSLLSLSLLMSAQSFAKDSSAEVQKLQKAIVVNKQNIETFLETKGYSISADKIARLEAERGLNIFEDISERSVLGNRIMKILDEAIVISGYKANYFKGQDAISSALSGLTYGATSVAPAQNAPKVYALTVLNPAHQAFVEKANEDFKKSTESNQSDHLLSLMGNYLAGSIAAKRFATYEEASKLSDNIARLNSDLNKLEEESAGLSLQNQKTVESFKTKIDEWMNKKIVFLRLNHDGINAQIIQDRRMVVGEDMLNNVGLNRNYSASNIAQKIRVYYRERAADLRNRGSLKIAVKDAQGKTKRYTLRQEDRIDVTVAADIGSALIQIPEASFRVSLSYLNANKMSVTVKGKEIYDTYEKNDVLTSIRAVHTAREVMFKSVYKNLGDDWFERELGSNTFSIK